MAASAAILIFQKKTMDADKRGRI
jgi:hypothetical protein